MNKSTALLNAIRIAIGQGAGRMFRVNTGMAYQGSRVTKNRDGSVTIHDARVIHAGLAVGGSDLIGWREVTIGPEHVGAKLAQFVAIEVKDGTGRPSKDQQNFIDAINAAGGLASVARSPEQAAEIFARRL